MIGRGRAHSAVSVINAIPCGIGATIGIELWTEAEFLPGGPDLNIIIENDPAEDTLLARLCVQRTMARISSSPATGELRIRSQIPVSRGLKSSSAAANAIVAAVSHSQGIDLNPMEVVRLGVRCALEAGVSITGAFDDACGSMFGGLVMTDNRCNEVLMAQDLEPMDVILHVPALKITKKDERLDLLRKVCNQMQDIIALVGKDPFTAMNRNGELVSHTLGLDNSTAVKALQKGALAAGMSGTGPAVAILTPLGKGKTLMDEMNMDGLSITRTRGQRHGFNH